MTTLTHTPVKPTSVAATRPTAVNRQVITCVAGGYRFALPTTHIAGVYQISREQISQQLDEVETPEGRLPVATLAELLSEHLGVKLTPSNEERALIGIRYGDQRATIRAGQISRPINVPNQHWHRLPKIVHPEDASNVVSAVANLDEQSEDPQKALALVIDPAKAIGMAIEDAPAESVHSQKPISNMDGAIVHRREGGLRRGSGQLLAFAPEFVSRQQLNFVFCLPLAAVAAVVSAQQELATPMNSNIFQGYVLWRKLPVPVVDLAAVFGLSQADSGDQGNVRARRLVIARASGNRYIGFYAQSQMQSMKTPQAIPTHFPGLENRPSLGAFKTDFGDMVIPNLDQILDFE